MDVGLFFSVLAMYEVFVEYVDSMREVAVWGEEFSEMRSGSDGSALGLHPFSWSEAEGRIRSACSSSRPKC